MRENCEDQSRGYICFRCQRNFANKSSLNQHLNNKVCDTQKKIVTAIPVKSNDNYLQVIPSIPFERSSLRVHLRASLYGTSTVFAVLRRDPINIALWIVQNISEAKNLTCYNKRYKFFTVYYYNRWHTGICGNSVLHVIMRALYRAIGPKRIDEIVSPYQTLGSSLEEFRSAETVKLNFNEIKLMAKNAYFASPLGAIIINSLTNIRIDIVNLNDNSDSDTNEEDELPSKFTTALSPHILSTKE